VQDMVQIGSGYATRTDPAAFVLGPAGLAFDPRTNTLYVASQAQEVGGVEVGTIFAIANASLTSGDHGTGTVVFADATRLHAPTGMALAPNGDLIIANDDGVNADPNQPSELVEITTAGQFVAQTSIDPLNAGPFDVAVTSVDGKLQLAALNDNQNTVTVWSFQTGTPFPTTFPGLGQNLGF
jgi:DNA-binding beta-propeller fold protein YncE